MMLGNSTSPEALDPLSEPLLPAAPPPLPEHAAREKTRDSDNTQEIIFSWYFLLSFRLYEFDVLGASSV